MGGKEEMLRAETCAAGLMGKGKGSAVDCDQEPQQSVAWRDPQVKRSGRGWWIRVKL